MSTPSTAITKALLASDLAKLTAEERNVYVNEVCASLNLNPLTKPFAFLKNRSGDMVLYATKDCTDQLRTVHAISVKIVTREVIESVYVVTANASRPDGRCDESTGAVAIEGKKGDDRANAMMKAETKAKRRVTLSICGLGMLDESEVDSVRGAVPVDEVRNTPEQQKELAQRRIEETRSDGPQGAAQSQTGSDAPTPAQAAPTVPEPLQSLVRKIEAREQGAVRNAFDFLKAYLTQISPEFGEAEYRAIRERHDLSAGTPIKNAVAALIEMYERGEAMRAAAIDDTVAEGVTDADVPQATSDAILNPLFEDVKQ